MDVVWVEHIEDSRSGNRTLLRVAPLSVAGLLRARLFGPTTAVLTSATLTVGGDFDAMAAAWGLTGAAETEIRWRGIDVGSPFDHARSAILYVAAHLPPPGRDGVGAAEQLIDAAGVAPGMLEAPDVFDAVVDRDGEEARARGDAGEELVLVDGQEILAPGKEAQAQVEPVGVAAGEILDALLQLRFRAEAVRDRAAGARAQKFTTPWVSLSPRRACASGSTWAIVCSSRVSVKPASRRKVPWTAV